MIAIACCIVLVVVIPSISAQSGAQPRQGSGPVIVERPENSTVLVHTRHVIVCKVTGVPRPSVRWYKDGNRISPQGSNYRTVNHGSLKFFRIQLSNKGDYRCRASNKHGVVTSHVVHVEVQARVLVIDPSIDWDVERSYGDDFLMPCTAVGIPQPSIKWYKDGVEMPEARNDVRLEATAEQNTVYECMARNLVAADKLPSLVTRKFNISVVGIPTTPSAPDGQCVAYSGGACSSHLANTSVYVMSGANLTALEARLLDIRHSLMSLTQDDACLTSVDKLMCHYVYPECLNADQPDLVSGRPICNVREACELIQSVLCRHVWPLVGINLPHSSDDVLNCSTIPKQSQESCLDMRLETTLVTSKCYLRKGEFYNGTVNVSMSGLPCVKWKDLPLYSLPTEPSFKASWLKENYCRNPGGLQDRPGCYVKQSKESWDVCEIPHCNDLSQQDDTHMEILSPYDNGQTITAVTVVCAIVSLLAVGMSVLLCKRYNHAHKVKYISPPQDEWNLDLSKLEPNEYFGKAKEIKILQRRWEHFEFPRNDIVHLADLGVGAFGEVFLAEARGLNGKDQTVAVKILSQDSSEDVLVDFEEELLTLSQLTHPNILPLLGVCSIGKPMCAIVEYMKYGDLDVFLRKNSCTDENHMERGGETAQVLSTFEQLDIAKQISCAMDYFTQRGFVHRDLAARNCLVGNSHVVKLSDLGLTRSIQGVGYYKGDDEEPVAVRWMSPEVILHNTYSIDSDIYSYGVLLWEIFSYGGQPYMGQSHEKVLLNIKDGRLLTCPTNTSSEVYDMMTLCWNWTPAGRPSFSTLYKRICKIQMSLEH